MGKVRRRTAALVAAVLSTGVLVPVSAVPAAAAPASVTIAGSMQSEAGCPADWTPDCASTHLTFDREDDVWQGRFSLPEDSFEYKAALNDSWAENYGANARPDGSNIALVHPAAGDVTFLYDDKSHWVTDSVNSVIATVPGDFQSELGCAGDWAPDCLRSWLQDPDGDGTFAFSTTAIPAGTYEAKVAIDEAWDENYGAGGARNGSNINVKPTGGRVDFYYDHASHWVTSSAQGPILTAPGSFQSELGCSADWTPDCMRPWLQDLDGDGTYTWASVKIPQGSYEFKVAHGLGWDESYPADNVTLTVPADGMLVTINYALASHQVSVSVTQASATPDLTVARAVLVRDDLIAYPANAVPYGADPATFSWRLHFSAKGGLALDAEAVTGGEVVSLTRDRRGLPASVRTAHPELADAIALRVDPATAGRMRRIMAGQVAVAMYDDQGRLVDATGLKRP